jgi:predicted nucleotidyltransferase
MSQIKEIYRRKEERRDKLRKALDSIVNRLKDMEAQKIILFGSLARGDVDINSDLDLFVLMPSEKTGKEWLDI